MLLVSSQRKYNFDHLNKLLDAFRTNSHNIIGRNPSMVIPLLANQDLTPMLILDSLRGISFSLNFRDAYPLNNFAVILIHLKMKLQ